MKHRNRAIHGDVVAVELLPCVDWRGRVTALTETEGDERTGEELQSPAMPTGNCGKQDQRTYSPAITA